MHQQCNNLRVTPVNPPLSSAQAQYQVRLDWGTAGASRIHADADVSVWVDVVATGARPPALATAVLANLNNRTAVAQWILAEQVRRGDRTSIAIIAAGTNEGGFAVEDFLAAGALIDALAALGIDFCSPEAAAAAASFVGLKGAVGHLVTASVTGRELIAEGQRELVVAAGKVDTVHVIDVIDPTDTVDVVGGAKSA
jgi:phosphosulfolactate phosphohydrolase-like enzyme